MKYICLNKGMAPWVLFPKKPRTGKQSHAEAKDETHSTGIDYSESTTDVASGRTGRAVPITGGPLLNTLGSVSDWESPVFADILLS